VRVLLKSDENNGYITWRSVNICDNIAFNSS
jgi:hypothetical protein